MDGGKLGGLLALGAGAALLYLLRRRSARSAEYLAFMDSVEKFKALSKPEKTAVAQAVVECHFKKGDYVITQGEEGMCLYLVYNGQVEAVVNGTPVKQYAAGDYFGERALLLDEPRAASVRACTECTLLRLARGTFHVDAMAELFEIDDGSKEPEKEDTPDTPDVAAGLHATKARPQRTSTLQGSHCTRS